MSATEEFRAMLDERGVRWDYGPSGASSTAFWVNGKELSFSNWRDGLICSTIFTPAQAIAVTLRNGTCSIEQTCHERIAGFDTYHDEFVCSECGGDMYEHFNFCPNCGRKVVNE